jgi:peptidyl-dipeptidase Dcp
VLVDTGSELTWIPAPALKELGVEAEGVQRFRDIILAPQNTRDLAGIYREFRGRDPRVDALLANRGLVEKKISDK